MKKKILIIISFIFIAILCILGWLFLLNNGKSYNIKITIPAGSTETYVYSDVEISPKKNKIKIFSGEGLGDTEVILKPIEVNEENVDDRGTYLTHGMPVKMEVEKGAWFRIGVNMQNPTDEDIVVYVKVKDVDLRIE